MDNAAHTLCKLCFAQDIDSFQVFSSVGKELQVDTILLKYFRAEINLSKDDVVCYDCWEIVNNFHQLYLRVGQNYQTELVVEEKTNDFVVVLVKQEMLINEREEDMLLQNDNAQAAGMQEKNSTTNGKTEDTAKVIDECKNNLVTISTIKVKDEVNNVDGPHTNIKSNAAIKKSAPQQPPQRRRTAMDELLAIKRHFNMKCDKCAAPFVSFTDVVKHYNKIHNLDGYMICKCRMKFAHYNKIVKHCDWHDQRDAIKLSQVKEAQKQSLNVIVKTESPNFQKHHKLLSIQMKKIARHFKMQCDKCSATVNSFGEAMKHYQTVHSCSGYLICCKCEKKLNKYNDIVEHIEWHDYPERFKCSECPKTFVHKRVLKAHFDLKHTPKELCKFKCASCPRAYKHKPDLVLHEKTFHRTREHECPTCHKKFAFNAVLTKHIKQVHELAFSMVCDLCAQFFVTRKSYEIHCMTQHSTVDHKVQCDECGKWLKHSHRLSAHKSVHHRKEEVAPETLQCTQCDKVFKHKMNLRRHVDFVHSGRCLKYECTVCHKMFKRKIALTEHLAIHEGRTDLYTCTFCPKTFRASSNMCKHRRKDHPAEWKKYKEEHNV